QTCALPICIVFGKGGVGGKFSGEQPAGQGAPGERPDVVPAAVAESRFEKMTPEQIELQLVRVEGGDLSPRFHLFRTEIADADGPDHALFVQRKQRLRRLFDWRFRVRPMDLIKV